VIPAITNGDDMVKYLITQRADVNVLAFRLKVVTPLEVVIDSGNNLSMIRILLENNAKLSSKELLNSKFFRDCDFSSCSSDMKLILLSILDVCCDS